VSNELWIAIVGVAGTLLGVALTQWRADKRDEQNRETARQAEDRRYEREQQRERAELERTDAERWLTDRRKVYAEFLTVTRKWLDLVRNDLSRYRPVYPNRGRWAARVVVDTATMPKTRSLIGELELWATPRLHIKCRKLLFALEWADLSLRHVRRPVIAPLGEATINEPDLRQLVLAANGAYKRALMHMRDELRLLTPEELERRESLLNGPPYRRMNEDDHDDAAREARPGTRVNQQSTSS
jgi:hypothetical protein